jgi:uncharacterized protein YjbJ (UPF0337 family)
MEKECAMNEDVLAGKWKQLKGSIKAAFANLSDDDLTEAEGDSERLLGKLQERYGYTRDEAKSAWDKFMQGAETDADRAEAKRHLDRAGDNVEDAVDDAKNALRRALD